MTKKIFSDAQSVVQEMRKHDEYRNKLFYEMDRMWNCDWNLPGEIAQLEWVRKVVGTDPHDNVRAATRILSALDPEIRYQPLLDNQASKQRANEIDRMLKTWLKGAGKRSQGNLIADYVFSALQYDMVVAYIDYVPYQKKLMKNKKNWNMGQKYGPYIISVKNPKDIHFRYSDVGLEHVVYEGVMKLKDIVSYWGKENCATLLTKYNKPEDYNEEFIFVDDTTLDKRLVWIESRDGQDILQQIYDMDNDIPFWRWAVRAGGTKLTSIPEDQYMPLNGSIYRSKQWEHDNLINTLAISEKIAMAASPRTTTFGVTEVDTDYQEPGGQRKVSNPDPNSLRDTPPMQVDSGLIELHQLYQQAMAKSGLPSILQGGDIPANTPFAAVNQIVQIGMGAIRPYRELAEMAIGDTCETMCRWVKHDGSAISVLGDAKDDVGKMYTLEPDDINEDYLCVTVELNADVPTDRQARATTAAMMVQQLGYSKEQALSEVGDSDPAKTMKQSMFEQLIQNNLEISLEERRMQLRLKEASAMAQIQAQTQMAVQQQQMAQQQQLQQQQMQEQTTAQAQNPATGGQPPAMGNPQGMTREAVTGATQSGMEVAGV